MFFTMTFDEIDAAVLQLDASALNCSMKIMVLKTNRNLNIFGF
jgi:hypothetical protein